MSALITAIARMNIAAFDDEALARLEKFVRPVRDHGTAEGSARGPKWPAGVEVERQIREQGAAR